jgi:mono/diheme cytochrome c family protein
LDRHPAATANSSPLRTIAWRPSRAKRGKTDWLPLGPWLVREAIWEMAMRRMTLFATLALAFVPGFSSSAGAQSPVERGEKVYAAEKCSVCHSIGGQGNTRGPLDGVGSNLSAEEIRQWIVAAPDMTAKTKATRKPPMRSYPNLPKDDVEALVAYMLSLKK